MNSTDPLEQLRKRFLDRCRHAAAELAVAHREGVATLGSAARTEVARRAHSLAGAGGTFGYPAVSENAALLEERLEQAPDDFDAINGALNDLVQALEAATETKV